MLRNHISNLLSLTYSAGANKSRRRRRKPYDKALQGGDSIGIRNRDESGTLGYFVKRGDQIGALTNYHVAKRVGNKMLSPSEVDGGKYKKNFIGTVASSIRTRNVDCAFVDLRHVCKPQQYMLGDKKGTVVRQKSKASKHEKYRYIGSVSEEKKAKGMIKSTIWSGKVDYGNAKYKKRFHQQILLSKPVKSGDSGSLLLNNKDEAIGLVFAGSDEHGLANPIDKVLEALEADIAETKPHTMKLCSHSKKMK